MQTVMLRALQQPSHLDGLLKSLVKCLRIVPEDAWAILDLGELTPELQKIATAAASSGQSWRAFTDPGYHFWLFVGQMSLPLSRERGSPVLQLEYHREHGLRETGTWVIDRQAKWHRCVD